MYEYRHGIGKGMVGDMGMGMCMGGCMGMGILGIGMGMAKTYN